MQKLGRFVLTIGEEYGGWRVPVICPGRGGKDRPRWIVGVGHQHHPLHRRPHDRRRHDEAEAFVLPGWAGRRAPGRCACRARTLRTSRPSAQGGLQKATTSCSTHRRVWLTNGGHANCGVLCRPTTATTPRTENEQVPDREEPGFGRRNRQVPADRARGGREDGGTRAVVGNTPS